MLFKILKDVTFYVYFEIESILFLNRDKFASENENTCEKNTTWHPNTGVQLEVTRGPHGLALKLELRWPLSFLSEQPLDFLSPKWPTKAN